MTPRKTILQTHCSFVKGMRCYLLLLQSLLCCVDILLHSHVDELILRFSLDHAGSLLTHSLDGLWDVDVTVQPYQETHQDGQT